jgi:predicted AlkP superfamily pyrophosphatase or phosphodiesterase
MVTSSFYASEYPAWVERFNRETAAVIMGDSVWSSELPPGAEGLTRNDTSAYEGDGVHTFFPHRFHDESEETGRRAQNRWAIRTPLPDEVIGAFAREAVRSLGLGSDPVPDFLGLSFSQPDFVGHDYGPLSREQLDNLVRLDKVLDELMEFLDDQVGPGRWVMALSGDHGTLTVPEVLRDEGHSAARADREDFRAIRQVFRDLREAEGSPDVLAERAVVALESLPFVADALTPTEMATGPAPDSFVTFLRNSYLPDRWFRGYGSQDLGVMFRFVEGFYPSSDRHGTGHGSPYHYDRHVPLVFFGPGVEPGISTERVRTVDAAPTLAQLAGIPMPSDLDGQPLLR